MKKKALSLLGVGKNKEKEIGIVIKKDKGSKFPKLNSIVVKVDKRYYRPLEVSNLLGDSSKAKKELGWVPKISFKELVADMMKSDLKLAEFEKHKEKI